MKKYKHKLTGGIAKLSKSGEYYKFEGFKLPMSIVEDSVDWELVLDYFKVLSFESDSGVIESIQENGRFFLQSSTHKFNPHGYLNGMGFSSYLTDPEYSIKSVMMLKDRRVFNVGQRLGSGLITGFSIIDGNIEVLVDQR